MTSKKKVTALNIVNKIIQWLPIGVYGCFNIDTFYSETSSGITVTSIFLIVAILFYFKDSFKQWIAKPSVFKYVMICWIITLVFVCIGEQLFIASSILLASFLCAIPFDVWAKHVKQEALEHSTFQDLKETLIGKIK